MLFDFTFEDLDRVCGGDRTGARDPTYSTSHSGSEFSDNALSHGTVFFFVLGFLLVNFEDTLESDDELVLDEDNELFFSLMGGTICFFLVILLGFFGVTAESDDELCDEDDDDDDDDESLFLPDPLGGSGSVFLPWVLVDGMCSCSP